MRPLELLFYVSEIDVEETVSNSFTNFHVKGFDYLNLGMTPELTVKAYFFDEVDQSQLAEVVNPHNHRYNFQTMVVAGSMRDWTYTRKSRLGSIFNPDVETFYEFDYYTPLLGGDGFVEKGKCKLKKDHHSGYFNYPGDIVVRKAEQIHTISCSSQCILLLYQFEDVVTDSPTQTFSKSKIMSDLDGLYDEMSIDTALKRKEQLKEALRKIIRG